MPMLHWPAAGGPHRLPPYSPDLNPAERRWQHTRRTGTRNRYFASEAELLSTLRGVFGEMQSHAVLIRSCLLTAFLLTLFVLYLCAPVSR